MRVASIDRLSDCNLRVPICRPPYSRLHQARVPYSGRCSFGPTMARVPENGVSFLARGLSLRRLRYRWVGILFFLRRAFTGV
jgi:hypothetical protein